MSTPNLPSNIDPHPLPIVVTAPARMVGPPSTLSKMEVTPTLSPVAPLLDITVGPGVNWFGDRTPICSSLV